MTVKAMIIPGNHQKLAVHAMFWSGQSILTPAGPSAMSLAYFFGTQRTSSGVTLSALH